MFKRWKDFALALGGFLGWVATMLPFFGIDARTLAKAMTEHYVFLLVSVLFFALFIWGCVRMWKSAWTRPENAKSRIDSWLRASKFPMNEVDFPQWHFGFSITFPNRAPILVARTTERPNRILLVSSFNPIWSQHRAKFDVLSDDQKTSLYWELSLETAKAKIIYSSEPALKNVRVEKWLPITARLAEHDIIEAIQEVYSAVTVIGNTVALYLKEAPKPSAEVREELPKLDEQHAPHKTTRQILTWVADKEKLIRYQNGMKIDESGMETIEALVKSSDDFQDENAVEEVCKELSKSRRDPFVNFELVYGGGSFKGKRLKFLQDARVHAHIESNADALYYIGRTWAKENGLPEKPYSPSPKFHPPNPRPLSPIADKEEPKH